MRNFLPEEVFGLPNIKSAKKRVLVNKTKAAQNKAAKSALKTDIKKFEAEWLDYLRREEGGLLDGIRESTKLDDSGKEALEHAMEAFKKQFHRGERNDGPRDEQYEDLDQDELDQAQIVKS